MRASRRGQAQVHHSLNRQAPRKRHDQVPCRALVQRAHRIPRPESSDKHPQGLVPAHARRRAATCTRTRLSTMNWAGCACWKRATTPTPSAGWPGSARGRDPVPEVGASRLGSPLAHCPGRARRPGRRHRHQPRFSLPPKRPGWRSAATTSWPAARTRPLRPSALPGPPARSGRPAASGPRHGGGTPTRRLAPLEDADYVSLVAANPSDPRAASLDQTVGNLTNFAASGPLTTSSAGACPSLSSAACLAETGIRSDRLRRHGGSGEAVAVPLERMVWLSHGRGRPRRTRRGIRGHRRPLVQLPGRSERRRLGPGSLLRYRAVDARTQPIKQNDKQGPRDGLHATGRRTVISARGAQPPASRNEMHRVGALPVRTTRPN